MKIAVVNLEQVVAQSAQGQELQRSLRTFQSETQRNILGYVGDLHELRNRLANNRNKLSKEQLVLLREEFEAGKQALQRFKGDRQRAGKLLRQQGADSIKQQLPPILDGLLNDNAYDVILNAKMVLIAAGGIDVTDIVMTRFSKTASLEVFALDKSKSFPKTNRRSSTRALALEQETVTC